MEGFELESGTHSDLPRNTIGSRPEAEVLDKERLLWERDAMAQARSSQTIAHGPNLARPSVQEMEWILHFSMAEKNQKMNTILSDVKLTLNANFSIQD